MKATKLIAAALITGTGALAVPALLPTTTPLVAKASAATSYTTYTVKSGDSLYRISKAYGVSVATIQSLNGMGSRTVIYPGQVLKVRAVTTAPAPKPAPAPASTAWAPNKAYKQPTTVLYHDAPGWTFGMGWTGTSVKLVQERLGLGDSHFSTFDTATKNAVMNFQRANHLPVTGNVDRNTWNRMRPSIKVGNAAPAMVSFDMDAWRAPVVVPANASRTQRIEQMIKYAMDSRGAHYTWGGAGSYNLGYDCSGLVVAALGSAGLDTAPQVTPKLHQSPGFLTTEYLYNSNFQKVPMAQRQRGDLIFYFGPNGKTRHVAIYLGGNQMIEASSASNAVKVSTFRGSTSGYRLAPVAVRPFTAVGR